MDVWHQQLLDPSTYPDSTTTVTFRETHISRVYLTDTYAYKLKKPLNLGFLDFTTLEKRRFYCHEEVRLNRRFAPETYLDVSELHQKNHHVKFDGPGNLIDYAVRMRRLPEECMLDRMIDAEDETLKARMPELADALGQVFKQAEPCCNERPEQLDVLHKNCSDNFDQTETAIGVALTADAHQAMKRWTLRRLQEMTALFQQRERDGYVRDGHGDLHAGNICMTTPIQVYDCIEFNRDFRVGDVAADLAFLLMDLEFRNRRDLANKLLRAYQSQNSDRDLKCLLPFYKTYRAWVRGKVDAILAGESDATPEARREALDMARGYFNLALGYTLSPALFLTCGLMGTGKTILAKALSRTTGANHLRSDVVRKQRANLSETTTCREAFGKGLYSAEKTEQTYAALLSETAGILKRGHSVIVDASFADATERQHFLNLASEVEVPAWILHLECPDEIALKRLDQRQDDVSDGRRELYADQKQQFTPISLSLQVISVDSTQPVDYNVQAVLCHALCAQERLS